MVSGGSRLGTSNASHRPRNEVAVCGKLPGTLVIQSNLVLFSIKKLILSEMEIGITLDFDPFKVFEVPFPLEVE